MEETYHVTFSEDDEAIYKSSTEGDEINFNENKSFPDDVFSIPRNNVSQCSGNDKEDLEIDKDQVSIIRDLISEVEPSTTANVFEIKPKKLVEALEEEGWIIAMQEEQNQFERNKVCTLNKARLVAQGYNQHKGIDYDETFAHVARLEIIRIFLAYAAYMGFIVFQMDVKSAFLNRNISEEVYVQQPPGFESSEFPNHVCKLDKSLYGLKQAPKAWYQANPKESYLVAIKRIFRYLKGTPNLGLWYPKGSGFNLKAYSDSDYAGCNLDRKSTSGGCQILGGKLVPIFCDNTSAIAISNNPVLHSRTKHIDISEDFVLIPPKETVKAGLATLGLTDENDALLSSSDLINSSPGSHDQLNVNQKTITEVNSDDITDKSLSGTNVQPVTLPKAPTDLKPRKKRIPPSSKPKSSKLVRNVSLKTQVVDSQLAGEPVQKSIDKEFVKESEIESLGIIPLEEFGRADAKLDADESPYDTEFEIKVVKKFQPT
ncbi:retrovirus-related pol polyprotein from transposon TNT 1-94 [Tanacetum coccineum]